MKKLAKILVLVLSVALLVGALVVVASAAGETSDIPVTADHVTWTEEKVLKVFDTEEAYLAAKASGNYDAASLSTNKLGAAFTHVKNKGEGYILLTKDYNEGRSFIKDDNSALEYATVNLASSKCTLDLNGKVLSMATNRWFNTSGTGANIGYQRLQVSGSGVLTVIGNGGSLLTASNLVQLSGAGGTVNFEGGNGGLNIVACTGYSYDVGNGNYNANTTFAGSEGIVKNIKQNYAVATAPVLNILGDVTYVRENTAIAAFYCMYGTKSSIKFNIGKEDADKSVRNTATFTTIDTVGSAKDSEVPRIVIHRDDAYLVGDKDVLTTNALLAEVNINNATVSCKDFKFSSLYSKNYAAATDDDLITYNINNSTLNFRGKDKAYTDIAGIVMNSTVPYRINVNSSEIYEGHNFINGSANPAVSATTNTNRALTVIKDSYISVRNDAGNQSTFSQKPGSIVSENSFYDVGAFTNYGVYWLDYDGGAGKLADGTVPKWPTYAAEVGGYGILIKDGNYFNSTGDKGNDSTAKKSPGQYASVGFNSNKLGNLGNGTFYDVIKPAYGQTVWKCVSDAAIPNVTTDADVLTFNGVAGTTAKDFTAQYVTTLAGSNLCLGASNTTARPGQFAVAANTFAETENTYVTHKYWEGGDVKYSYTQPYFYYDVNTMSATAAAAYPLDKFAYYAIDFDLMTTEEFFTKDFNPQFFVRSYIASGSVASAAAIILSPDGTWKSYSGDSFKMDYTPGVWQHVTTVLEMPMTDGAVDYLRMYADAKIHLYVDGELLHTFTGILPEAGNAFSDPANYKDGAKHAGVHEVRISYLGESQKNLSDDAETSVDNVIFTRYAYTTTDTPATIGKYVYDNSAEFGVAQPEDIPFATVGDELVYGNDVNDAFFVKYINSLTPSSLVLYSDYKGTFDVSKAGNFTFFSYKTNGYNIPLSEELPTYYDEETDILTVYGPGVFAYAYKNKAAYDADKADGDLTDFAARIACLSDISYWTKKLDLRYVVFISNYDEGTDALDSIDRNGDGDNKDDEYEINATVALPAFSDFVIDLNGYRLTLAYTQHIPLGGTSAATFTYQRLQINNADVTLVGNGGSIYSAAALFQFNGNSGNLTVDGGNGGITLEIINGKRCDRNTLATTNISNSAGGSEGFFKFGTNNATASAANNSLSFLGDVTVNWNANTGFLAFITMYPQAYNGTTNLGNTLNFGKDTGNTSDRNSANITVNAAITTRKPFIMHRDDYDTALKKYTVRSTVNFNNATLINPDLVFIGTYNKNFAAFDDDYVLYNVNNTKLDFSGSRTTDKTITLGYAFPINANFVGCELYDNATFINTSIVDALPQAAYRFNKCYISVRDANNKPTTFSQGVFTCLMEDCYLDVGYASNCGMYWLDYNNGSGKLADGTTPAWPWYTAEYGGYGFYIKDGNAFSNTSAGKGNNSTASKKPGGYTKSGNNGGSGGNKLGSLGKNDIASHGALLTEWGLYGYVVNNAKDASFPTGTDIGRFDGTAGSELKDYSSANTKSFLGYTFVVGNSGTARKGKFTAAANPITGDGNTYVVYSYYQEPELSYNNSAPYISVSVNSAISDTTAATYKMNEYGFYAMDFDLMTPTNTFTRDFNPQFYFKSAGSAGVLSSGVSIGMDKTGVWTDKSNKYEMPFTPGVWQHITIVLEMPVKDGAVNFTGLDTTMQIHLYIDGVKVKTFDDLNVNAGFGNPGYYNEGYTHSGLTEIRVNFTSGSSPFDDNAQLAIDNFSFRRYYAGYTGGVDGAASFIYSNMDTFGVSVPQDLPFATYDDVVIDAENAQAGLEEYLKAYLNGTTKSALNLYTDYVGEINFVSVAESIGKTFTELKYVANGYEIPITVNYVESTANGVTTITEQTKFTVYFYGIDGTLESSETVYVGTEVTLPKTNVISSNGWYKVVEKWTDAKGADVEGNSVVVNGNLSYYRAPEYAPGMELMQYNLKLMGHTELMLYIPTENIPAEVISNTLYKVGSDSRTAVSGKAMKFAGAYYNGYSGAYVGALSIANPLIFEVDTVVSTPNGNVTLTSRYSISPLTYLEYIIAYSNYYKDVMPVAADMLQYTVELYKLVNGSAGIEDAEFYNAYVASAPYRTKLDDVKFSEKVASSVDPSGISKYVSDIKFVASNYESAFALDFIEPAKDAEGNYIGSYVKAVNFVLDGWLDVRNDLQVDLGVNSGTLTYGIRKNLYYATYSESPYMLKKAQSCNISIHNIIDEKITVVLTVVHPDGSEEAVSATYNLDAYYCEIAESNPEFATYLKAIKAYSQSAAYYRYGNFHHYHDTDKEITVKYSDFGAVGDGIADDVDAIRAAHAYANSIADLGYVNVTVVADKGKSYRVGDQGSKSIVIKTSTDWEGANFILDDKAVANSTPGMSTPLFKVASDYSIKTVNDLSGVLTTDSKNIGYAPGYKALVILYNDARRNYIRHGSNADNGYVQQDIVLVDAEGNISDTTPLLFNTEVTRMEIIRTDDTPITVKGGNFTTIYNSGHSYIKYSAYNRGVLIQRSNVTFDGAEHDIDENTYDRVENAYMSTSLGGAPVAGGKHYAEIIKDTANNSFDVYYYTGYNGNAGSNRSEENIVKEKVTFSYHSGTSTETEAHYWNSDKSYYIIETVGNTDSIKYGTIKNYYITQVENDDAVEVEAFYKGAPMGYFVRADYANNVNIKNCVFECPKSFYYMGTGGSMVVMGSYANTAGYCNEITWENCVQRDFRDADGNVKQQGQMGSNYCKNMYYIGNKLSRLDAHKGAGNITVRDCEITRINLIGGGNVLVEDSIIHTCESNFVFNLRSDYGGIWMGDVTLNNVTIDASRSSSSSLALFTLDHSENEYGYGKESKDSSGNKVVFENTLLAPEYAGFDNTMPTNVTVNGLKIVGNSQKTFQLATGNIDKESGAYNVETAAVNPYKITDNLIIKGEVIGYIGSLDQNCNIQSTGTFTVNFAAYENISNTAGSFDGVNIDTSGITNR